MALIAETAGLAVLHIKKGFELMQYAIFQIMRCEMHRAVEAVYTKLHREGVTLL